MFFRVKFSSLMLLLIFLLAIPLSSQAISISAFRIYLDADKPISSFTVHNPEVEHQACCLKLPLIHVTNIFGHTSVTISISD